MMLSGLPKKSERIFPDNPRSLDSTLTYINVERAIFGCSDSSEFHVKIARMLEEIKSLLEVGFEYICEKDGLMFFRKRK